MLRHDKSDTVNQVKKTDLHIKRELWQYRPRHISDQHTVSDTGKALKNELYIYFDTLQPPITTKLGYERNSC